MVEWMVVGIIWATAIVMIAHTIDEAVRRATPRRLELHRFPGSLSSEEQPASCVQPDNNVEVQRRAA